jgi:hypothetical protein
MCKRLARLEKEPRNSTIRTNELQEDFLNAQPSLRRNFFYNFFFHISKDAFLNVYKIPGIIRISQLISKFNNRTKKSKIFLIQLKIKNFLKGRNLFVRTKNIFVDILCKFCCTNFFYSNFPLL